eukprot:6064023-Pleurochrysis_carterae.AAC.4
MRAEGVAGTFGQCSADREPFRTKSEQKGGEMKVRNTLTEVVSPLECAPSQEPGAGKKRPQPGDEPVAGSALLAAAAFALSEYYRKPFHGIFGGEKRHGVQRPNHSLCNA